MIIRKATMDDLEQITEVEATCFPAAEAASKESFAERLTFFPNHFLLMFDGDRLISFVNGFTTDEEMLTDQMYHNAALHNEAGKWQMIFGVNTIPEYRRRGLASQMLKEMISIARQ